LLPLEAGLLSLLGREGDGERLSGDFQFLMQVIDVSF
jgi:hypothetical protein